MLRLEGLVKTYPTGDQALKGVTLEVPKGQVMALIGPSGAGKSTLIRCINRLVEPSGGKVFLGDQELTRLGGRALRRARRRMGMIFQEYALVERLSVMENVLSGRLGYVGFWRSYFRKFPQSRHRRGLPPAGAGRARPHGRQAGRRAVRRSAAAGRHRPRADPGSTAPAGRRADRRAWIPRPRARSCG